jgi:hypothetical protein
MAGMTNATHVSNDTAAVVVEAKPCITQSSLVEKIHQLLKPPQEEEQQEQETEQDAPPLSQNGNCHHERITVAFEQERLLAAWVLLTRLEQVDLELIWRHYGSKILEPFAVNDLLLQGPDFQVAEKDNANQSSAPKSLPARRGLYLRLIAQVMARIPNGCASTKPISSESSSVSSSSSSSPSNTTSSLGLALFREWQQFSSTYHNDEDNVKGNDKISPSTVLSIHLDVLRAIEVWVEQDAITADKVGVLAEIWNHYASLAATATTIMPSNSGFKQEQKEEDAHNSTKPIFLDDWELMTQTLQGLLTTTSSTGDNGGNGREEEDEAMVQMAWHETVVTLFQSNGSEMLPDAWIPNIIEWITNQQHIKALPPVVCQAWHEWLLSMIQTRVPFDQPFRLTLFQQAKTMTQVNRLLLAHVVSPQTMNFPHLRALAWQTMFTLVESCGWQWILMTTTEVSGLASNNNSNNNTTGASTTRTVTSSNPSASRLGMAVGLCTWIRLAAGEWRIQLQAVTNSGPAGTTNSNNKNNNSLMDVSLSNNETKPTTRSSLNPTTTQAGQNGVWQQATGLPVGHACAQLLIGVVHFCVQLEEEQHHPHRRIPQLSVDALLHLRTSLQGGLLTTVEYLQSLQREERQMGIGSGVADDTFNDYYETPHKRRSSWSSATRAAGASSAAFESIAIKLLGTLLMEVDIWLLQEIEETANDSTTSHHQTNLTTVTSAADMIQGVLECLQYILPESHDYSLLPGIVSILAGAEEQFKTNPRHVTAVMTNFWDPLVEYLEGYWQRSTTSAHSTLRDKLNDTVAWACSCTEMYVALDDASKVSLSLAPTIKHRHRRLALSLIEWIQTVLQVDSQELFSPLSSPTPPSSRHSSSPLAWSTSTSPLTLHKLQSYLSLAVGCYMTLSKNSEKPPREHESRVIYRALQVCEMQQPATTVPSRLEV